MFPDFTISASPLNPEMYTLNFASASLALENDDVLNQILTVSYDGVMVNCFVETLNVNVYVPEVAQSLMFWLLLLFSGRVALFGYDADDSSA